MKSIDEISKNPKNSVRVRIKFNLYIYISLLITKSCLHVFLPLPKRTARFTGWTNILCRSTRA